MNIFSQSGNHKFIILKKIKFLLIFYLLVEKNMIFLYNFQINKKGIIMSQTSASIANTSSLKMGFSALKLNAIETKYRNDLVCKEKKRLFQL